MLFSERIKLRRKLLWQSDTRERYTCSSKLRSRNFAIASGCKVPDLYWFGPIYDIPWDYLPNSYVLKPDKGYSSIGVFPVKNNINLFTDTILDRNEVIQAINSLTTVKPPIEALAEELLETNDVLSLNYKLWMFGTECVSIAVVDRKTKTAFHYNLDWTIDYRFLNYYRNIGFNEQDKFTKPAFIDELVENANRLMKRMTNMFMRVDFLYRNNVIFNEFTPTPSLGLGHDYENDKLLGELWKQYLGDAI